MYRSTCLVERGMIYLFAPGIWTEFKLFIKGKRLSFAADCKGCNQLKMSTLLFNHHLCFSPSPLYLDRIMGYVLTSE